MDILTFLNSDMVLPAVMVLVIAVYGITRVRNWKKYKRD